jgi:hypothetical protein
MITSSAIDARVLAGSALVPSRLALDATVSSDGWLKLTSIALYARGRAIRAILALGTRVTQARLI